MEEREILSRLTEMYQLWPWTEQEIKNNNNLGNSRYFIENAEMMSLL